MLMRKEGNFQSLVLATLVSFIAVTFLIPLRALAGDPGPGRVIIQDLSGERPASFWKVTGGGNAQISDSDKRSTRGKHSVRIDYVTSGWQIVQLLLKRHEVENWMGGDVLEWDMYVEAPDPVLTFFQVNLIGKKGMDFFGETYRESLPTGEWLRFSIPLRRAPGTDVDPYQELDRSAIEEFRLRLWPSRPPTYPSKEISVYIDNLRVVSTAQLRLEQVKVKLESIRKSELLGVAARGELEALLSEEATLSASRPGSSEEREALSEKVLVLEDRIERLSEMVMDQALRQRSLVVAATLAETLGFQAQRPGFAVGGPLSAESSGVGRPGFRVWKRLADLEQENSPEARRASALAFVLELAQERLRQLYQQVDMEREYPGAGFAVGLPFWPQAWRDGVYTGRIGREVRLHAARNEYEPFQLVVLANHRTLKNVRVEVSDLTGETGSLSASHIEVAPQGWRKLQGEPGWVADMLRPDILRFDVEKGAFQPVWINVYVPPAASPGVYRGKVTVHADGVNPETIDLELEVWPFVLPKYASLPTATNYPPADGNPAVAKAIIDRRWNPFQMYRWSDKARPATLQQWTEMGASLHNLLQISRHSAKYGQGPDGKPVVTNKEVFFKRLDPIVNDIRQNYPELWEHVILYGFDEPDLEQAIAMDDLYGDLKARYGGIRTMFADLYGLWSSLPELPENVDIWTVSRSTLTPNARDLIQNAGMEVWWWNAYNNPEDPAGLRIQFWSTLKDGLDGLLFYHLNAGGGGIRNRENKPWTSKLWPDEERMDGGMMRLGPNGEPVVSISFDYWREGMEDVEYLFLLRERRNLLAERVGEAPADHQRDLLREADRMLRIPDTLTTGLFGNRALDVNEIVVRMSGHTDDMNEILAARMEIARLIQAIDRELGGG